jgi:hypothetical protein
MLGGIPLGWLEKTWPRPVLKLMSGEMTPEQLLRGERHSPFMDTVGFDVNEHICSANFFIAEWHLLHARNLEAKKLFARVVRTCPKGMTEYISATAELARKDPGN